MGVVLEGTSGESVPLDALYIRPPFEQQFPPLRLLQHGCLELDDDGYIRVDDNQRTSIDGVMACGDCTTPNRSLSVAMAGGTKSAKWINYQLSVEDWNSNMEQPQAGSS